MSAFERDRGGALKDKWGRRVDGSKGLSLDTTLAPLQYSPNPVAMALQPTSEIEHQGKSRWSSTSCCPVARLTSPARVLAQAWLKLGLPHCFLFRALELTLPQPTIPQISMCLIPSHCLGLYSNTVFLGKSSLNKIF